MASLPQLPNDIIEDIFERLPTKEITQCKVLSKQWYQQISGIPFIRRHFANMSLQNRVSTLLQLEHCFVLLQYFEMIDGQRMNRRVVYHGMRDFEYVASCESVVLVANLNDEIYLLNPTTNQHFYLPQNPIGFPPSTNSSSVLFGVGYNPRQGDFQVLRISLFHCMEWKSEMKIYPKSTNQWKNFGEFPHPSMVNSPGVYANNCVHWLLFFEHIVVFDLVDESFRLITLPKQVNRDYRHHSFTALNNNTIVLLPTFYMINESVEIWILSNYSNDNSWERHYVQLDFPIREVYRVINFQPLYFVEPNRKKIVFRVNPLGTFWCWDLEAHRFQPFAGEQVVNIALSAFPVVEGLS